MTKSVSKTHAKVKTISIASTIRLPRDAPAATGHAVSTDDDKRETRCRTSLDRHDNSHYT